MAHEQTLTGPDLTAGVSIADIADGGMLLGHAHGEAVLLARRGEEIFAVGATCTHYSGPLAEGLVVGETIRCPWHHACFSLRTGEALRAPALNPISCWNVAREGDTVRITERRPEPAAREEPAGAPSSIVIIGAGAAGGAAAEMVRREGYEGPVTLIGAEESVPVDRPNLSKDYLAGNAPEEWVPLRPREFYAEQKIELLTGVRATAIDTGAKRVTLSDGRSIPYGALLLATGADPIRLPLPGADLPHVFTLRTWADSRAIIAAAAEAPGETASRSSLPASGRAGGEVPKRAVVMGASFIGLEVAASLRARGLEVHVVAPEDRPLERVMGPEVGDFIRALHESHGVIFHLGQTATAIDAKSVTLRNGETLPAELVVIGAGVRPSVALAEQAGLAVENGVQVNEYLETSVPGIYAAGDIARWPDPHSGRRVRIEHWVVAQRQGQTAARNMVGRRERFDSVPFFWSAHYDLVLAYVGHAERWDRIEIDGRLEDHDCTVTYWEGGKKQAVLTLFRDLESLREEAAMEAAV
jgi:NADPH-dependent 2,4-dienoyl-CoA reductase/sulfur reductase-like enzyme/nitrite reductase/ring-hydroxylating ferredoxin subunit